MAKCPFCQSEIKEKYQFCPSCDQRVRCANCGDYLLEGKDKCYVCGEPVQEEQKSTMNTFELREESTEEGGSREVNIEISNEGMENAGRIVERLFGTGKQFDGTREIRTEPGSEQPPTPLPPNHEASETEDDSGEEASSMEEESTASSKDSDGGAAKSTSPMQSIDVRDIENNYELTILSLYDLTEIDQKKP